MTTNLLVQYAVIALLVLISVLYTFRKLAPQLATRWQAGASSALNKPWRAAWLRRLGRWLQPRQATGSCGDGCGTCGSCGPKAPATSAQPDAQPLVFRPRGR
ncbi:DUF6587 family protein [Frateuria defendens]|uniref:DUF6587 family protein n=1 Tax=Frateuria defendens TaxID=2219559 RepID=UPI00066FC858|nr:DUF6587 family protein [Frateuria defendens]